MLSQKKVLPYDSRHHPESHGLQLPLLSNQFENHPRARYHHVQDPTGTNQRYHKRNNDIVPSMNNDCLVSSSIGDIQNQHHRSHHPYTLPPPSNTFDRNLAHNQTFYTDLSLSKPKPASKVCTKGAMNARPKVGTLYFGAYAMADSLVGGCAWSIVDVDNNFVIKGSAPVVQEYNSSLRLELEALLNGLKAAFTKKIRRITIRSDSIMVLNHLLQLESSNLPYFQCIYHSVKDLTAAILKLLPHFYHYESELISTDENSLMRDQARDAILSYFDRKFDRIVERQTVGFLEEKTLYPSHHKEQFPEFFKSNVLTSIPSSQSISSSCASTVSLSSCSSAYSSTAQSPIKYPDCDEKYQMHRPDNKDRINMDELTDLDLMSPSTQARIFLSFDVDNFE